MHWCRYDKAKAYTLESHTEKGIFDVDGEVIPYKPIQVECHYSAGLIIAPPVMKLPAYVAARRNTSESRIAVALVLVSRALAALATRRF
jgi:hypothetical protein